MGHAAPVSPTPADEPVAVVGWSCRLPGAADADAFWRMLREGRGFDGTVPAGRRRPGVDGADGTPVTAALLDDIAGFDADFFGISPREALAMDPQQRLLLELGWEALEHARARVERLGGSRTGVFVGAMSDDYARLLDRHGPDAMTAHSMVGRHRSILANRISHQLGLSGPSFTIDSGQSSSLVAIHVACESLRRGESDVALAGGVNLMIVPESTAEVVRFGGLSPDGRSFTFDERANGYVRGEGGAVVVLRPLSAALAAGDRVLCVVLGSAVNNDGATVSLTRPSAEAQREAVELAHARAGVEPGQVGYVELHGTGTPVGDPVEAAALGAVFGGGRAADDPLLVGSAKTNVGHLEGAAGVVGLLRAGLALHHAAVPAMLNHDRPNPAIPLAELGLRVPTELEDWPHPGRRIAGVSSFGMGGTNCHVVLGPAPSADDPLDAVPGPAEPGDGPVPWLLSAPTEEGLRARAAQLLPWTRPPHDPAAVGLSLATTRHAHALRAAVLGEDGTGRAEALEALARGERHPDVVRGRPVGGGVALLFSGQGFQRRGMGRELAARHPVFADALDEVCRHLDPELPLPLRRVMWAAEGSSDDLVDRTEYTQPALFAIEVALYRLVASWGVRADLVLGHSVGEIAAAHAAGALSLPAAARLVAARGRAMAALPPGGAMVAVEATEVEVRAALEEAVAAGAPQVALASVNGPTAMVLSGPEGAVEEVAARFADRGRRTHRLTVSHAFHSSLVDDALPALRDAATGLEAGPGGDTVLVSTLRGTPVGVGDLTDPEYWARHARHPVRFADAVAEAHARGARILLEIGPGNGLALLAGAADLGRDTAVVAALGSRDDGESRSVDRALGALAAHGLDLDWKAVYGPGTPVVDLPTHPFRRRRFWPSVPDVTTVRDGDAGDGGDGPDEPDEPAPRSAPAPSDRGAPPLDAPTPRTISADTVLAALADVLGHDDATRLDRDRTFTDAGLDSPLAVELRDRLEEATGLALPATVLFDHPTPARLAAHLTELADGAPEPDVPSSPALAGDPVAVVGIGCRYPGGIRSADDLWRVVSTGTDTIGELPDGRGWDLRRLADTGLSATSVGGFLDDADRFDAAFFGINPREAAAMDPQQRVLLETAWEAVEHAGIDATTLRGRPVGVFVGATAGDYGPRLHEDAHDAEGYLLTGSTTSVASGRIAYVLGLEGPALTVDTACSSSLVALHLAVDSLRRGECELALAGGVAVMATPGMFVEFSRQQGLAPDGHCKPFAADADGTAWAEGTGVLVLQRLSEARRDGRSVLAVVRGTAVNQDGASNGLTAPNGPSQVAVVRRALADAGLSPGDVDAVEAHGTGTPLGDPIEAGALIAAYGPGHGPERPLHLGSLKSNVGHTQAAAGVGGIIKMIEAMRHGQLPPTLHAEVPSPHVDWDAGVLSLLTAPADWPDTDRPRRAAVSSFGISGTNAHAVIEQPEPAPDTGVAPVEGSLTSVAVPWVLSAPDAAGLRRQAARWHAHVADRPELGLGDLRDIGFSLATTRTRFRRRAGIVVTGREDALDALAALAEDRADPRLVTGTAGARTDGPGPVFVFPGQGSQWLGMGLELLESSAPFRDRLAACDAALRPHTGWSVHDALRGGPEAPSLDDVDVVQPVLFAVLVSLAAVWESVGVRPAAVIGHSQGEIAAACVAGALDLDDAAAVVALRSRAIRAASGTGGMVSVPRPRTEVVERLAARDDGIEVAAVNGPSVTVVAGPADALARLVDELAAEGVTARTIDVDYASHTSAMDGLRDRILGDLAGVRPRAGTVPLWSTRTGALLDTATMGAEHWFGSLRSPVEFHTAVRGLLDAGHRVFVEVSPHPVLAIGIDEAAAEADREATVVPTLRRDHGGPAQIVTSLLAAHVHGVELDWAATLPGARRIPLPTYAFATPRYWLEPPAPAVGDADLGAAGIEGAAHPLLGAAVELPDGGVVLTGRASVAEHPWLGDHVVDGTVLLPGTAFVDLVLRAAEEVGLDTVEDLTLERAMPVGGDGVRLRVVVGAAGTGGRREAVVWSRPDGPAAWTRHAAAVLTSRKADDPDLVPAPPDGDPLESEALHGRLAARGYGYGPAFRGLAAVHDGADDLLVLTAAPAALAGDTGWTGLHPALLDTALHALIDRRSARDGDGLVLPFAWSGIRRHGADDAHPVAGPLRMRLTGTGGDEVGLVVADAAGRPLLSAEGITLRPAPRALGTEPLRLAWPTVPADRDGSGEEDGAPPPRCAVVGAGPDVDPLADVLPELGPAHADLAELRRAVDAGAPAPDLVLVPAPVPDGEPEDRAAHAVARWALALVQAWSADDRLADARLVVVTRGAVHAATGDRVPTLAHATVWGLLRSAITEDPGRLVLLDLPQAPEDDAVRAALAAARETHDQLAVRGEAVRAPRVARAAPPALVPPAPGPWRLDLDGDRGYDRLALVPHPGAAAALGPGEVRLSVRAAGINFRDVTIVSGLLPGETCLGIEAAGVVAETGPGVDDLAVGDPVTGLVDGAFAPVAIAERDRLVRVPAGWSFAEAATAPVVLVTAYQCLVDVARVRPGERVLVHAAAGGVGIAAVRLARLLGAEVFGTASPTKVGVLRELGLDDDHIASSRTLDFEPRFRAATGGRGVDVVLDSLAGDFVDASLRLLVPGGRFVEMGKTDIRDAAEVAATHGVAYTAYNLRDATSASVATTLAAVADLVAAGEMEPLPVTAWDVRRGDEALRHLAAARHVGKLALTVPRALDPHGTVLVTGGTGTLGRVLARHLATGHGVRHLLLLGRSATDEGVADLRAELAEHGATVEVARADAADRDALAAVLAGIPAQRPLTAVVHAAGVLSDSVVSAMTPEALEAVLRPKVDGAWHLHELTRGLDLAAFVCFSSVAGVLGDAGQGNYAAANQWLDALAARRRAEGLPATSLVWGFWDERTGMTAHLGDIDVARLRRSGMAPLATPDALALFDAALAGDEPAPVLLRPDLGDREGLHPLLTALADELPRPAPTASRPATPAGHGAGGDAPGEGDTDGDDLADRVASVDGAERDRMVLEIVLTESAAVLGHDDADALAPEDAFTDVGFDSLTGIELRNRLSGLTGLRLSAGLVTENPTPEALSRFLVAKLAESR